MLCHSFLGDLVLYVWLPGTIIKLSLFSGDLVQHNFTIENFQLFKTMNDFFLLWLQLDLLVGTTSYSDVYLGCKVYNFTDGEPGVLVSLAIYFIYNSTYELSNFTTEINNAILR